MSIEKNFIVNAGIEVGTSANVGTSLGVGGALTVNSTVSVVGSVSVGNATVVATVNSTAISLSNTSLTTTSFSTGNSTVNTSITNTRFATGNTTTNTAITSTSFTLGNTTTNTSITATSLSVGNSTVNSVITPSSISVDGTLTVQNLATFQSNVLISGNLVVQGTTTFINSNSLDIGDNIITLNADLPPSVGPTENAGIEINRGSSSNVALRWNETDDRWQLTTDGTNYGNIHTTLTDIVLGTQTSGNYVATVTQGTGVYVTGSGSETAAVTVAIGQDVNSTSSVAFAGVTVGNSSLKLNSIELATNRFIANTTGVTVTGFANVTTAVNTALFTTGGGFTANNTLVNTAAINVVNQVNTATLFATTSANVGANVQANTTAFRVGDATTNTVITATTIGGNSIALLGNSTINGDLTVTGNSTIGSNSADILNINANTTLNTNTINLGANLSIDAGTLFIDSLNNSVGVGTTTPDAKLQVVGTANVTGNFVVGGMANVTGNATVTGLTTLNGGVNTTTANASVAFNVGANVQVNTTTIRVGNATVNTVITSSMIGGNSIAFLGNSIITGDLTVTGNTVLGDAATDLVTIYANSISLISNGSIDAGTLFVDSLNNRVGIGTNAPDAPLRVVGAANVTGNAVIGGTANVTGNVVIGGTANITGNAVITGTANVTGLATLNGGMNTTTANASVAFNVGANVNLSTTTLSIGNSTVNVAITSSRIGGNSVALLGNSTINGDLTVTGNSTLGSSSADTLTINANTTLNTNTITLGSNLAIDVDTFFIDSLANEVGIGTTTPNAKLQVAGTANVSGNATVGGTTLFVDTIAGEVGIGTISPDTTLKVQGNANVTGNFVLGGMANVIGNTNITGNATITGLTALNGGMNTTTANASAALNVGASVQVNTTAIRVGTTVNSVITSTMIGGNSIAFLGNTIVSGDLTVTGNTQLGDAATDLVTVYANSISLISNVSIDAGTLFVDSLNNRVGIGTNAPDAPLRVVGAANVTGNVVIGGTANVTGNIVISGAATSQLLIGGTTVVANSTGITGTLLTVSQPNITAGNSTNFNGLAATAYVSNSALQGYSYINSTATAFNSSNLAGLAATAYVSNSALNSRNFINATTAATTYVSNSALTGSATAYNAGLLQNATWDAPLDIGLTTPAQGTFTTLRATQNIYIDTPVFYLRGVYTDGSTYTRMVGINAANSVFVGAIDAGAVDIRVYGPTSAPVNIYSNALFHSSFAANGNLGVNTPSPAYQLDVSGDVRSTTTYLLGSTVVANTLGTYATHLGGVAAASYVNSTGNFTVSGNIAFTGANTTIGGVEIGYLTVPQNANNTSYTIVAGDSGKHIFNSTNATSLTYTLANNTNVPLDIGTAITMINGNTATITIAGQTGVTIQLAGTTTTGSRTLAAGGLATALKVGTNRWFVSGAGVS